MSDIATPLVAWPTRSTVPSRLASINEKLLDYYGIAAFVALWELLPRLGWVDRAFIPPPSAILAAGWKIAATGELFRHIVVSLERVLLGFAMAVGTAVPLGFVLGGYFPRLTKFLAPLLSLFGQVNAFSLFPVFILFFGIGEVAKLVIIFWTSLWPILSLTIAGIQNVDPSLVKTARSMGASKRPVFFKVLLPGAAPSIFTGIHIGLTVAFLMLIAAEMLGASSGLGWLILNSQVNYMIPRMFAATVTMAILGMGANWLLRCVEARVVARQGQSTGNTVLLRKAY
jgi:NitT/TauT family transport system permease protein